MKASFECLAVAGFTLVCFTPAAVAEEESGGEIAEMRELVQALEGEGGRAGRAAGAPGRGDPRDALGFSTRFEYAEDDDAFFGFASAAGGTTSARIFSITGTTDYALADSLMLRGEVRWDTISESTGSDGEFLDNSPADLDSDQVVAGVELVCSF